MRIPSPLISCDSLLWTKSSSNSCNQCFNFPLAAADVHTNTLRALCLQVDWLSAALCLQQVGTLTRPEESEEGYDLKERGASEKGTACCCAWCDKEAGGGDGGRRGLWWG